jgi:hypothetical protein
VVIAGDEELRRDYGLSSAFIIYPALGVCAAAYAVFARATRIALWLAVAGIGATLLTLIRGEIFGLGLGLLVLLIIRSRTRRAGRVATIASITAAFALFFVVLTVNDPLLARGIAERSLPGLTAQSAYANSTADYRLDALRSGLAAARARPAGSGFISPDAVAGLGTDPGYLGHSSPAWLLFYAGWPGLLSGIAAALAVLVVGLRAPASRDWIRPAFVATWLMLVVSSLSADALVGQPWVVMLAALTLALRFAAQQEPTKL